MQFSSVQFSSVQFSSVQFSSVQELVYKKFFSNINIISNNYHYINNYYIL
ncbi:hypothetical protein [uncultured Brachyspira sp.]|nr:hypothetical protein [uncultured Brachyspira sp.]